MPPYFLTIRLPYMLLGTDAAHDLDLVLEPQLIHQKKAHVFYEVDSQAVAKGLLDLFRFGKPSPGISGDPTKPVGSLEGARKLIEGACQPVFDLLDAAALELPQRVLYRGDLELLERMSDCEGDPGIRQDAGLPNDRRIVLVWEHYERARGWEPLLCDEMGVDKNGENVGQPVPTQDEKRVPRRTRKRKKPTKDVEAEVLTKSRRRCCICFALHDNMAVTEGQIAHLDHDRFNSTPDNLVWLCLRHHDQFDSKTSQSKNLTVEEVRHYRDLLYQKIEVSSGPVTGIDGGTF